MTGQYPKRLKSADEVRDEAQARGGGVQNPRPRSATPIDKRRNRDLSRFGS